MQRRDYIYFLIIAEAMQIIDIVLTSIALSARHAQELNPLYSMWWFLPLKLAIPILLTLALLYIGRFKHYSSTCVITFSACYAVVIANNMYWVFFSNL